MKALKLFIVLLFALPLMAFAQDLPGQSIFDQILKALTSAEGQTVVLALVVEFALRLFKSEKPLGILYMVSGVLKTVGQIVTKAAAILDKILPQRIK